MPAPVLPASRRIELVVPVPVTNLRVVILGSSGQGKKQQYYRHGERSDQPSHLEPPPVLLIRTQLMMVRRRTPATTSGAVRATATPRLPLPRPSSLRTLQSILEPLKAGDSGPLDSPPTTRAGVPALDFRASGLPRKAPKNGFVW